MLSENDRCYRLKANAGICRCELYSKLILAVSSCLHCLTKSFLWVLKELQWLYTYKMENGAASKHNAYQIFPTDIRTPSNWKANNAPAKQKSPLDPGRQKICDEINIIEIDYHSDLLLYILQTGPYGNWAEVEPTVFGTPDPKRHSIISDR